MAGTRSAESNLNPRFQFRLDLRDPQQNELARQLQELPGGQRNRYIIERLLSPATGADTTSIKAAMREVLIEFSAAAKLPPAGQTLSAAEPAVPDDVYDIAGLL